jgi:hypothetical protein
MKDPKAPYKGLTPEQFMAKRYPDMKIVEIDGDKIIVGQFCGYADGPMTDVGCMNVCERYSSCTAAMETNDLMQIIDQDGERTWCDVCGDTITSMDDVIRVGVPGRRYKVCSEGCADVVRSMS